MPILGYNYGAADEKRFTRTLALSFGVALAIMVIGTVLFWTMPEMLLKLFQWHPIRCFSWAATRCGFSRCAFCRRPAALS